jgi:hypothetical protein
MKEDRSRMKTRIDARVLANAARTREDEPTATHYDSGGVMAFTKLGGCDDGTCPSVKQNDTTGDLFVQGYEATAEELAAVGDVPAGERVVRIPAHILTQAAQALARQS